MSDILLLPDSNSNVILSREIRNYRPEFLAPSEISSAMEAVQIVRNFGYMDSIVAIGSRTRGCRIGTINWQYGIPELGFTPAEAFQLYDLLNNFVLEHQINQSKWNLVYDFALSRVLDPRLLGYIQDQGEDLISDLDLLINVRPEGIPHIHLTTELAIDIKARNEIDY